jgi:FecR-like protein/sporulation related protein
MLRRCSLAIAAWSLMAAPSVLAAEAVIHGLQAPAWIERADQVFVAQPGAELRSGDKLHTGVGGRLELDLADGSRFQIGEQAVIGMESLAMSRDEQGEFFDSVMNVIRGAFRFTTRIAGGERRRSLRIRAGNAIIGIRGTDVWGRVAQDGRTMMVLIEGSVTVDMADEQMTVATPMMAMLMQGDQHREQMATAEQLAPLVAQTDMRSDSAMLMMEGRWALVVISLQERAAAEEMVLNLARAGYPSVIRTVEVDSGTYHRVVIERLMDSRQASMLAAELEERLEISGAWVLQP